MEKVLIIAEAGVNHNGDLEIAKRMIDAAADAQVDVVKFQTAIPELVVSESAEKADYQKDTTGGGSQLEMIKKIHFPLDTYIELKSYCEEKNIQFLSTPFDSISIQFLHELKMKIFKIPSGEITNKPYLAEVGKVAEEVILSTGMATIDEIGRAIEVLESTGLNRKKITILHCNTDYPTQMGDVNLLAMHHIQNEFNVKVGYSDHTLGIEVPIAAAALGAKVIEKHFTLDRNMDGPDQKASLIPSELSEMVKSIRNIEAALGNGIKKPTASELKNRDIVRRSIVAKEAINEGDILSEGNMTVKRPGNGISPMEWENVLGEKAKKSYKKDELI